VSFDAISPTSPIATSTGTVPSSSSGGAPSVTPPAAVKKATDDAAHAAAELESARQAANKSLQKNGCELAFEFDDASGRVIARLIDTKTKEVLRQVPSRETLAIAQALADEQSHGVLLHTNA